MPPKKQVPKLTYNQATNLSRSEIALETPHLIDVDPSNMHSEPNVEKDDTLRLYADGEPFPLYSDISHPPPDITMNQLMRNAAAEIAAEKLEAKRLQEIADAAASEKRAIASALSQRKTDERLKHLQKIKDDYEKLQQENEAALRLEADILDSTSKEPIETVTLPTSSNVYNVADQIFNADKLATENDIAHVASQSKKRNSDQMDQIFMSSAEKTVVLEDVIDENLAVRFFRFCSKPETINQNLKWQNVILRHAMERIKLRFMNPLYNHLIAEKDIEAFPCINSESTTEYTMLEIAELVKKIFGPAATVGSTTTLLNQCREHTLEFNMKSENVEDNSLLLFGRKLTDFIVPVDADTDHACSVILGKKLPRNSGILNDFTVRTKLELVDKLDTTARAIKRIKKILTEKREHLRLADMAGPDVYASVMDDRDKTAFVPKGQNTQPQNNNNVKVKCPTCGKQGHVREKCGWWECTMANQTKLPWDESPMGKLWANNNKTCLTVDWQIPNYPIVRASDYKQNPAFNRLRQTSQSNSSKGQNKQFNPYQSQQTDYNKNQSPNDNNNNNNNNKNVSSYLDFGNKKPRSKFEPNSICSSLTAPVPNEYLNVSVSLTEQATAQLQTTAGSTPLSKEPTSSRTTSPGATTPDPGVPTHEIKCAALLDSGSIAGNFINADLLNKLNGKNRLYKTDKPLRVCSGLDNHCLTSLEVIDIEVKFCIKNMKSSFILTCHITSSGPVALIIGRDSIKENDLVTKLPRFFFKENNSTFEKLDRQTHSKILPCECDTILKAAADICIPNIPIISSNNINSNHHSLKSPIRRVHFDDTPLIGKVLATLAAPNDALHQTHSLITEVPEEYEQLSRAEYIGADEIDNDNKDLFAPFRNPPETSANEYDFINKMLIGGCEKLQKDLKDLCKKYKSIFRTKIGPEPARIPPFDLDVDLVKWETPRNRCPYRYTPDTVR